MVRIVIAVGLLIALILPTTVFAKGGGRGGGGDSKGGAVRVRPYTKKDSTLVEGHRRSGPDSSKSNNWSSKGNVNPDTGKPGTK